MLVKSKISCWWNCTFNFIQYIDWAADQGALSLAYEIGISRDSDKNIDLEVEKAIEDFKVVIDTGISKK